MRKILVLISLLLSVSITLPIYAKRIHVEQWYQIKWCKDKGEIEYRLPDKTRVDCLTKDHAVEFDFANKWAEAIGQSLHYSKMTGKKAGIVIIVEEDADMKYVDILNNVIERFNLPIDIWEMRDNEENKRETTKE